METMVSSSFKSRECRQSEAVSAKNAKNLQKSEKTLNLNEMSIYHNINLGEKAQSKKMPSATPMRKRLN
ncbi:adenine deaminase [Saonia flava]|uniref:Adenine deaminase n=1 Tax=Saonia flava TaxID=523696 RepID=A0A846QRY7_9FLAO|nr:hypothetical protein [Saonia flava]NJB69957.1 adenine deaminase [Saonia flava]